MLHRILSLAGQEMVLIGGQALALWAAIYQVLPPVSAITKDVDFIGSQADVKRIAAGIAGKASFPHERSLTLLMGQVSKSLPGDNYVNIDVLFKVYGDVSTDAIKARAVTVGIDGVSIKLMHPLDVLQGRLENLYGIPEKQDEHGLAQLILAIEVVQKFLLAEAIRTEHAVPARSVVLKHVSRIETMALSDAGRKVAQRFGVHVADAIEPAPLLRLHEFGSRKLPQLIRSMSAARQQELRNRPEIGEYR
jgi:hypothetical protein